MVSKNSVRKKTAKDTSIPTSVKLRAIIFMIILSLLCYGLVALLPHYTSINATTSFDDAIPFIPIFIIFYILLYAAPFPFLSVFSSEKRLARALSGHTIIMIVGMIFFIAVPIEFIKHVSYDSTIFSSLTKIIHGADTNFNNFPSLHVACTVYFWLVVLYERKRLGLLLAPFAWGIIFSVLFVKQHLIIDLIGGIALGAIVFTWYISSKKIIGEPVIEKMLKG